MIHAIRLAQNSHSRAQWLILKKQLLLFLFLRGYLVTYERKRNVTRVLNRVHMGLCPIFYLFIYFQFFLHEYLTSRVSLIIWIFFFN